jgi:hypothetical protein
VWGRARWGAVALVLAAGCASGGVPGPSGNPDAPPSSVPAVARLPELPGAALPGYVVHDTSLDATAVSADALDPPSLLAVLTGAAFRSGAERRFTAREKPLTEVVTRVILFGSPEGARTYLAWIGSHGADLLGSRTEAARGPGFPGSVAFSHGVSGCCTKDTFQYFAAWIRGAYALTLRVGGPRAGPRTAMPLALAFDDRVRKET